VKKILLSQGYKALIDDSDFVATIQFRWYARLCKGKIYAARHRKKHEKKGPDIVYLHRFLMEPAVDMQVDHKNGDTLDNRRYNLRVCTRAENLRNAKKHCGFSKYKGVVWSKQIKRWTVKIQGKHIGTFLNEEDAACAYDGEARRVFGDYAILNFPEFLQEELFEEVPV